ncbi:MAG TPA: DUF6351 family protein [Nocardioidaceae bacterium]
MGGAVAVAASLTTVVVGQPVASADPAYRIHVLSSSPDLVTGGDARIAVDLPPGVRDKAVVRLNGADVTEQLRPRAGGGLEGVVDGMVIGDNELSIHPTDRSSGAPAAARTTLTNFPEEGPVFSGPQQYPFVCKTERVGLGQPIVDNDSEGFPVFAVGPDGKKTTEIVGYSRDCAATDQVAYYYKTQGGRYNPLPENGVRPDDMATTTLTDGREVDFVIRWERGTINRFIYSIAMLVDPDEPDSDELWNGRLTYSFDGGVAIGHTQGELSQGNSFQQSLGLGYAVISSTGTRTSVHYNLQVGGETALMVKEEFIERHGVPEYTVGVGGSGGAIQQYVYAQNHPGLIDAAVPQYSYPDMVTQTIHVGDCELLEYYMDVTDRKNEKWYDVRDREALQGLHATDDPNISDGDQAKWRAILGTYGKVGARSYDQILATGKIPLGECRQGWFGLAPLALNPTYGSAGAGSELMAPEGVMDTVEWTHFDDLVNIYGKDASGYAKRPWDNVGVQYGLGALEAGRVSPEEFLRLNATIGGWTESADMKPEAAPFPGGTRPGFDPWSSANMTLSADGGTTPAPRTEGDVDAMNAAYESGLVFQGDIDIPVIDWRHYREADLDMHNSHQSFASRQRMLNADGDASNQVVWFTDGRPGRYSDQTPLAFEVIDEWMSNLRTNPELGVAANKPEGAVDRCFTAHGEEIAAGDDVWNGILDDDEAGACTDAFPLYSTSRIVAGGPIEGGVFKCTLQPVDRAIESGVYGDWVPDAEQERRLEQIFPSGVCDYSEPDLGKPRT